MTLVGNPLLPEQSLSAPAITSFRGQLYIAWQGDDKDNHLNIENLATSEKTTLADTTSAAPVGAENFILVTRPGDIR